MGEAIPLDQLRAGFLYRVCVQTKHTDLWGHAHDYEADAMAVYRGDGEYWIRERVGPGDRRLAVGKDYRLGGTVRPTGEVGRVNWNNDEELEELLSDYHAGPRVERANFVRFEPEPTWMSSTVCDLCDSLLRDGDFGRLPLLADALMDAGCDCGPLLEALQTEREPAYGRRLVALLLGGEHAEAVKWLEGFAQEWNFSWVEMLSSPEDANYSGLTAQGIDLHGSSELKAGDEDRFWRCVGLLNGKEYGDERRQEFYWGCSC